MSTSSKPDVTRILFSQSDLYEMGIRYSRAQLNKLIARGEFPRPVKISKARNAFVAAEIDAWLAARMAERAA